MQLIVNGIRDSYTFDVEPLAVDSNNEIYVTKDKKILIKVVDELYLDHYRSNLNYLNPRLINIKRNTITIAQKNNLDLQCFNSAIQAWEKALPIDFGTAYKEEEKIGCGIINNYLCGCALNKSLGLNLSMNKDDVKHLIKKFIYEASIIHMVGMIHMDMTPPNIILDAENKEIYIIDWDLAQICESSLSRLFVGIPNYQFVPLPPGFNPENSKKAPSPHFDIWYIPVDILNIIAVFDPDMRRLFGELSPSPLFFIDIPTIGKLLELKNLLEKGSAKKTWPPDHNILKKYKYFIKKINKKYLEKFREIVSRYVNPELFYVVYVEMLNSLKYPETHELQKFV